MNYPSKSECPLQLEKLISLALLFFHLHLSALVMESFNFQWIGFSSRIAGKARNNTRNSIAFRLLAMRNAWISFSKHCLWGLI